MSVELSVQFFAGGTEATEENLPQYRFVHHKSHMTSSGIDAGQPRWDAGD
jgi:hypothetical protein